MYSTLAKILVREFYLANIGLFLVVILFLFGMLTPAEHYYLGIFLTDQPANLIYFLIITLLYNFNSCRYLKSSLKKFELNFISWCMLLPAGYLFWLSAVLQVLILLPILVYGTYLFFLAVYISRYSSLITLLAGMFLLVGINLFWLYRALMRPYSATVQEKSRSRQWVLPFSAYYFFDTWKNSPARILFSKLFSTILLAVILNAYMPGEYYISFLTVGSMIAFSGNSLLVFKLHDLYMNHLGNFKNLPFKPWLLYIREVVILSVLLCPEAVLLFKYKNQISSGISSGLFVLGLSILLVYRTILLFKRMSIEPFLNYVLILTVLFTFVFLYRPPIFLLLVIFFSFSFILFRRAYYLYSPA